MYKTEPYPNSADDDTGKQDALESASRTPVEIPHLLIAYAVSITPPRSIQSAQVSSSGHRIGRLLELSALGVV